MITLLILLAFHNTYTIRVLLIFNTKEIVIAYAQKEKISLWVDENYLLWVSQFVYLVEELIWSE